jgi:outer membrane lipoprotein-sorting protein
MSQRKFVRRLSAACCGLVLVIGAPSWAQMSDAPAPAPAEAPAADLPSGESIIDRYVEKSGGKEAFAAINSRVTKATMNLAAMGISGTMVISQKAPSMVYVQSEITGIGKVEQGSDGKVLWERNPMMGLRLVEGAERDALLRQYSMDAQTNWRNYYTSATTVGMGNVDGKDTYKVEVVDKAGAKSTMHYEVESGLLVRMETVTASQMGDIPMVASMSEYKDFAGTLIPTKVLTDIGNGMAQMVMEITDVQTNVEIPETTFALPEDVRKLVNPPAAAGATPEAAPAAQP